MRKELAGVNKALRGLQKHTKNQQDYEAELITKGFMEAPEPYIEPEPVMDYKAEILKLQDEVKKLKDKR